MNKLDTKVRFAVPREVYDLLSRHGYIAMVRGGEDKTKASVEAEAGYRSPKFLPESNSVSMETTRRGAGRLLEWVREIRANVTENCNEAAVELRKVFDDAKSSTT